MDFVIAWQMWVTLIVIAAAIVAYATDRYPLELVSAAILSFLLVFFQLFPVTDEAGQTVLGVTDLLSGFASPALFAIMGLLIVGQGMYQSGALDYPTRLLLAAQARFRWLAVVGIFLFVMVISAVLNNTPVVVMFIPIMTALAAQIGIAPSKLMLPLSFVSILGGMTTPIGSSTNLLAVETYRSLTGDAIGFFDLAPMGLVLAASGALYLALAAKYCLPDRQKPATPALSDGKQFLAQIDLGRGNPLIGERPVAGLFPSLKDVTVRQIHRRDEVLLPPFDDTPLRLHDKIVIAATRKALTGFLRSKAEFLAGFMSQVDESEGTTGEVLMVEAIVAPGSRIIGRSVRQIRFRFQTNCIIAGIQRRSRMIRADLSSIRLEAGDVLLIMGDRKDITQLRGDRDILMLERSMTQLPDPAHAGYAGMVFLGVVGTAASGLLPISVAAIVGAALMVATGCLNVRQAARAIDRRVYLLVGVALGMGLALERTGGAMYLGRLLTPLASVDGGKTLTLSLFFILAAGLTNVLSNNATVVLFAPIAISAAAVAGISPEALLLTIVYGANCSFATPVSYQTNLLVMGPGNYRFGDFIRIGVPLTIVLWIVYSVLAPIYFQWQHLM
ncbi:MAG: SLC13 family permease [Parvularcula sp.]